MHAWAAVQQPWTRPAISSPQSSLYLCIQKAAFPHYTKEEPITIIYRQINCYIYVYKIFSYLVRSGNATEMVHSIAAPMELARAPESERYRDLSEHRVGQSGKPRASQPPAECGRLRVSGIFWSSGSGSPGSPVPASHLLSSAPLHSRGPFY